MRLSSSPSAMLVAAQLQPLLGAGCHPQPWFDQPSQPADQRNDCSPVLRHSLPCPSRHGMTCCLLHRLCPTAAAGCWWWERAAWAASCSRRVPARCSRMAPAADGCGACLLGLQLGAAITSAAAAADLTACYLEHYLPGQPHCRALLAVPGHSLPTLVCISAAPLPCKPPPCCASSASIAIQAETAGPGAERVWQHRCD